MKNSLAFIMGLFLFNPILFGQPQFSTHIIATNAYGARDVYAIDLDGDSDIDVLSASAIDDRITWYENNGSESFTYHDIYNDSANASYGHAYAYALYPVDLDDDNDIDVLSVSYHGQKLLLHENDGSESFTTDTLATATLVGEYSNFTSVYAIDIDSDGDMDICASIQNNGKIIWLKNDGTENFTLHHIAGSSTVSGSQLTESWDIYAIDVDGDNDIDILSASAGSGAIPPEGPVWHENDGSENFFEHFIGSDHDDIKSVFAIDLDGDNDIDILCTSIDDDRVTWYENDGSENFSFQDITTSKSDPLSIYAIDVDSDNDIDVLTASMIDNTIAWYENDGSENFTIHDITTNTEQPKAVFAIDLDGDSDTDILSASSIFWTGDNEIAWYENIDSPTIQATNILFSNIQANQLTLNWTDGNGSKRAVFIKQDTTGTAVPVNDSTYTADTTFGSGTQIGTTGWYCVFNGTIHASGVTVTGLSSNTNYRVMVCEYNGASGAEQYNTSSATNNPKTQETGNSVIPNYSLQFDGTNDYVSVTNNLGTPTQLSGCVWVKFPQLLSPDDMPIIANWSNPEGIFTLHYGYDQGVHHMAINLKLTGGHTSFLLENNDYNIWLFICFTFDGDTLRIYKNGEVKNQKLVSGTLPSGSSITTFGTEENYGFSYCFEGNIDEVSLWNIELTQGQIQNFMCTPPSSSEPGLKGLWLFNEGTGTTTADSSAYSNDGTLMNGPNWSTDVPSPTSNAGPDQISLIGTSTTLAGNTPDTLETGTWSVASGTGGSITDSTNPTSAFSGAEGTWYELVWTISNSCNEVSRDTVQISFNLPCPGLPTVVYEGKTYNTVQIGTQCWFKENLDIGVMISSIQNQTDNDTIEKFCYGNNSSNCDTLGGLYQWQEIMGYISTPGAQGICPNGWHIPTDNEFKILEGTVDSLYGVGDPEWDKDGYRGYDAGKKLKSTSDWLSNDNGTDFYGYTALASGMWYEAGNTFRYRHESGIHWSSNEDVNNMSWRRLFNYTSDSSDRARGPFLDAFSVRCLKDSCSSLTSSNAGSDQISLIDTSATLAGNTPGTSENGTWSIVSGTGGAITDSTNPTTIFSGAEGTWYELVWTISNSCNHTSRDTVTISFNLPCPGFPTVNYEGKTYNTVQIGTQCWLKENLDVGVMIPGPQNQADNDTIEKYCYNNVVDSCSTYGGLYQWDEMMNYSAASSSNPSGVQGICPSGWHIPSDLEWTQLTDYLGGETISGGTMKEVGTIHWLNPNTGATDSSNFTALPGGYRNWSGINFGEANLDATFWSTTEATPSYMYRRTLKYNNENVFRGDDGYITYGYGIRCIKDTCSSYDTVSVTISTPYDTICAGDSATFTATAVNGGSNPVFQWKINGSDTGTNSAEFNYFPLANDTVACILTSNATCITNNPATSNGIIVCICSLPIATTTPQSQEIVSMDTTVAVVLESSQPATIYTWSAVASSPLVTGFDTSGSGDTIPPQIISTTSNIMQTVTYSVTPLAGGCSGVPVDHVITVYPIPPSPVTVAANVPGSPGMIVEVPIDVKGFDSITSISLRMDYDPTNAVYDSYTQLNPVFSTMFINEVSVSPTLRKILFAWSDLNPVTVPNNSILVKLRFTYNSDTTHLVWNNTSNNGQDCEYADAIGDPLIDIPTWYSYINGMLYPGYMISGSFNYNNSAFTPLDNMWVYLFELSQKIDSTQTDTLGNYVFSGLNNGTFSINAECDKEWGGVNGTDAAKIERHFVGISPITEPVRLQAADPNNSVFINATDALLVKRRFVQLITSFARGDWTFAKPLVGGDTVIVSGSDVTQNFYGLCVGDVNGSYVPEASTKSTSDWNILGNEYLLAAPGQIIELPIYVDEYIAMTGLSMVIGYPDEQIEVVDLDFSPEGLITNIKAGRIRAAWSSPDPFYLAPADRLITLRVQVSQKAQPGDLIRITIQPESEIADEMAEPVIAPSVRIPVIKIVPLDISNPEPSAFNLIVFPNPARDQLMVEYMLLEEMQVEISLLNSLGQMVATLVKVKQPAGKNHHRFDIEKYPNGIYMVRLSFKGSKTMETYRKIVFGE